MREQPSSTASRNSYPSGTPATSTSSVRDSNSELPKRPDILRDPDPKNNIHGANRRNIEAPPESSPMGKSPMRLLVVDESTPLRNAFCNVANDLGFAVEETNCTTTAREILKRHQIGVLLLDVTRAETGGQSLLEEMKVLFPQTPVIVMSADGTIASAVKMMRMGACDYLSKPFPLHVLAESLKRAAKRWLFDVERRRLQETLSPEAKMRDVLGRSAAMEKLYRILSNVADSGHPVMILGENGTGKSLVAQSIHSNGPHARKPFVALDCKTLGPTLLESELFGCNTGELSDANKPRPGRLVSPKGGTLFLDEIGEMPLELQGKLIRALKDKEIRPKGATAAVPISVRILAATNRDLTQMLREGKFRMDLYQILSVVNLRIPPLRGRPEDITFLAKRFLEKIQDQTGIKRTLSAETLRVLETYDWPDNVRELEQSIVRACSQASGAELSAIHLPQNLVNFHRKREVEPTRGLSSVNGADRASTKRCIVSIAQMEQDAIREAIRQANGDKKRAAQLLGIGKTTLYRKLKEYDLADLSNLRSGTFVSKSTIAS